MTTSKRFDGESSPCRALDPRVLRETSWVRASEDETGSGAFTPSHVAKANEHESQHHGSGARTPSPIAKVSEAWDESQHDGSGAQTPSRATNAKEDMIRTLQKLGAEVAEKLGDVDTGPPHSLRMPPTKDRLQKNSVEEVMSMNLTRPSGAASSSMQPQPPHLHSEPMFIRRDQGAVTTTESVKPTMKELIVSEDDVGLPLRCVGVHKSAKKKGGSQQELFAKAGSEDGRLKEAQSVATKLVSLLGGSDPFANKAKDSKVVASQLSPGTMGHLRSCRSLGGEARSSSGTAAQSAAAWDLQGRGFGDGTSGAGYSAVAQGVQGSVANRLPVSSFDEISTVAQVRSNPAWGRNQEELHGPQTSPQGIPLAVSVGSMGHPHNCGPPCKFATSTKGCKDGRHCSHCHICHWSRHYSKTCNKQPHEITAWTSF